jgi:transcriptional regulator with XRE-family HTH domain
MAQTPISTSEAAALLREARYAAGLTQAVLAERLGVSQAAIAKLERPGANPTLKTLQDALLATGHRLVLSSVQTRTFGTDEGAD